MSTPRQPVNDTLTTITLAGIILIPILTAIVAAATWLTASRTLRPVEAIRRQVERTDPTRLDHHVPEPGTGDEIDRLATTMNDMLDRLHQASQQQRRFISDASHELRSPITATLAAVDSLASLDPNDMTGQWPNIADTIRNEQHRLAGLVDDLLLLAELNETRTDTSRATPAIARIDTPQRIQANRRLLERCLANLVDNASRHAASRVDIIVTTNNIGEPVMQIDDDGPGIAPEHRDAVFERFSGLDEARNRTDGGAGLGLAIAQHITHQHGVTITITNSPAGGARFDITFPNTGN